MGKDNNNRLETVDWLSKWIEKNHPNNPMGHLYKAGMLKGTFIVLPDILCDYIKDRNKPNIQELESIALMIENINWTDVLTAQQQVLSIHNSVEDLIRKIKGS